MSGLAWPPRHGAPPVAGRPHAAELGRLWSPARMTPYDDQPDEAPAAGPGRPGCAVRSPTARRRQCLIGAGGPVAPGAPVILRMAVPPCRAGGSEICSGGMGLAARQRNPPVHSPSPCASRSIEHPLSGRHGRRLAPCLHIQAAVKVANPACASLRSMTQPPAAVLLPPPPARGRPPCRCRLVVSSASHPGPLPPTCRHAFLRNQGRLLMLAGRRHSPCPPPPAAARRRSSRPLPPHASASTGLHGKHPPCVQDA